MPFHSKQPEVVCKWLAGSGVTAKILPQKRAWAYERAWLDTYAHQVRAKHGKWVVDGYRWHGFSSRLVPSVDGDDAIDHYLDQWASETVLFDEQLTFCLRCEKTKPHRSIVESLGFHDFYLCHHNMKWTLALTHESGWLGPYFSSKSILGFD